MRVYLSESELVCVNGSGCVSECVSVSECVCMSVSVCGCVTILHTTHSIHKLLPPHNSAHNPRLIRPPHVINEL